jgi:uncharacterized membrane protein YoaK (UPF0700 family)
MERITLMSTVTTSSGSIERQTSGVGVRNWLFDALTFSSGSIDSISFLGLGKVFTAFMTGNVAFLGMGIAGNPLAPHRVGPGVDGRLRSRHLPRDENLGRADEWRHLVATDDVHPRRLAPCSPLLRGDLVYDQCRPGASAFPILLAIWALAMGLQSGAVRKLHVEGIFTTAATGTLMALAADLVNWRLTREERRRARSVLISLFIGATAGAYLFFHARIFAPVLPLVVTVGVVLTAARVHWSSDAPTA